MKNDLPVYWALDFVISHQLPMPRSALTFVPVDFNVPEVLETAEFRLRMLTVHDVVKDYDAVIISADHLRTVFGPDGSWPDGLTLEQNLIDLGWHQKEFQRRTSFAYTVVTLDETQVLGCVYIYPSPVVGFDAVVYLWARRSTLNSGLEERLYATLKAWLLEKWPFEHVAFPGRDIGWEEWSPMLRE